MCDAGRNRGYLAANGVDYAVALAELSPITTGMLGNEAVAELCQEVDCLIPFCSINPFLVADLAGELERYVIRDGLPRSQTLPDLPAFLSPTPTGSIRFTPRPRSWAYR